MSQEEAIKWFTKKRKCDDKWMRREEKRKKRKVIKSLIGVFKMDTFINIMSFLPFEDIMRAVLIAKGIKLALEDHVADILDEIITISKKIPHTFTIVKNGTDEFGPLHKLKDNKEIISDSLSDLKVLCDSPSFKFLFLFRSAVEDTLNSFKSTERRLHGYGETDKPWQECLIIVSKFIDDELLKHLRLYPAIHEFVGGIKEIRSNRGRIQVGEYMSDKYKIQSKGYEYEFKDPRTYFSLLDSVICGEFNKLVVNISEPNRWKSKIHGLSGLKSISIDITSSSPLDDISIFSGAKNIEKLHLYGHIKWIDLSPFKKLKELLINSNNVVETLDIPTYLNKLKSIKINRVNNLYRLTVPKECTSLYKVNINTCGILHATVNATESLKVISSTVIVHGIENSKIISLTYNLPETLKIPPIKNLRRLYLTIGVPIKDIVIPGELKKLTHLVVNASQSTSNTTITIPNTIRKLKKLSLSNINIKNNFNISQLTHLWYLILSFVNVLGDFITISKNTDKLSEVTIEHTNFKSIVIKSPLWKDPHLNISSNGELESIGIEKATNLLKLTIHNNPKLKEKINIKTLKSLVNVDISDNHGELEVHRLSRDHYTSRYNIILPLEQARKRELLRIRREEEEEKRKQEQIMLEIEDRKLALERLKEDREKYMKELGYEFSNHIPIGINEIKVREKKLECFDFDSFLDD